MNNRAQSCISSKPKSQHINIAKSQSLSLPSQSLSIPTLHFKLYACIVVPLPCFNINCVIVIQVLYRTIPLLAHLHNFLIVLQAAIGGLALDRVMEEENPLESDIKLGTDVLTLSVLAIIICAPVGATLMVVLGPRFLVKGHEDDAEVEVHTKEESSKTTMAVYDGSNNEKGETNWAFVNDLQTDNEVKIYAAETDLQTGQICHDCEEKEMADLNETITKEFTPVNESAPVKDTITILTVDDTDISKLSTASNTEDNNGMQEVLSESQVIEDANEVQMSNDVLGNDNSVDKSTDTDNVQKDGKRPLYVSSIVVELNDNKV